MTRVAVIGNAGGGKSIRVSRQVISIHSPREMRQFIKAYCSYENK